MSGDKGQSGVAPESQNSGPVKRIALPTFLTNKTMEEDIKNIKLEMDYYDENCKYSVKIMTIKFGKPVIKRIGGFSTSMIKHTMMFSMVLPDHIHSFIIGKTVAGQGMGKSNDMTSYELNFPKTISSDNLENLCNYYHSILRDYCSLKHLDKIDLKKVIFYTFSDEFRNTSSSWNGTKLGKSAKLRYGYYVGYVGQSGDKEVRYNDNKKGLNSSYDGGYYSYNFVEWTEEREKFFISLDESFKNVGSRISQMSENINEDSIDGIISSNTKMLN